MAGTCGYGEGLSGSINAGNFLTSCKVYWLASQEGLCSMEYVSKSISHSAVLRFITCGYIITKMYVQGDSREKKAQYFGSGLY